MVIAVVPDKVVRGAFRYFPFSVQHWFAEHLYRDVISVCGFDGRCFLKNDDAITMAGYPAATATRRLVSIVNGTVMAAWNTTTPLPLGGGSIAWFCLDGSTDPLNCPIVHQVSRSIIKKYRCDTSVRFTSLCRSPLQTIGAAGCAADGSDCVLDVSVTDGPFGPTLSAHTQFLGPPAAALALLSAPQPALVASVGAALPDGSLPITLSFTGGASVADAGLPLCTTLTTPFAGRFSRNAFTPLALPAAVSFLPWGATPDPQVFVESLRVQHLGQYGGM